MCGRARPRLYNRLARPAHERRTRQQPQPLLCFPFPLAPPPHNTTTSNKRHVKVAFEALSNLRLIPAWDVLFKGGRFLAFERLEGRPAAAAHPQARAGTGSSASPQQQDHQQQPGAADAGAAGDGAAGACAVEAARLHLAYGLPGVPRAAVRDRDFVLRALRVFLPSGARVLCVRSAGGGDGGLGGAKAGDPAPGRQAIRCALRRWQGRW